MTLPTITASALTGLKGIRHAFFTREGGVSTGIYASLNGGVGSRDNQTHVLENRRRMAEHLGVTPEHFLTAYQVHSPDAVIADAPFEERPQVDAIVTATRGLAIGVTTADCGPVLLADPVAGVIGTAHAGWKGAQRGILDTAVARMEQLGSDRKNIIAVLGPCIRQASYEVGADFRQTFEAGDDDFFAPALRAHHLQFDLGGYIAHRLRKAGVGTVEDLALDTYADEERFFSYRRTTHRSEPDYGRMIAAIVLEA